MKSRCEEYWDGIVELSEGRSHAAAQNHVESCRACAAKLAELRMILGAVRPQFDAPSELIDSVKGLVSSGERRRLTLVSSTLSLSGARGPTGDFQVLVGSGDTQLRVMYSPVGDTWQVVGRAPNSEYSLRACEGRVEVDADGRFIFRAPTLADTGFVLAGPEGDIDVPSAEELLSNGSGNRD